MIGRFVLKRLGIAFLQLIGVALVVFFMIRMLPADPVARLVGMNASKDAYEQSARALGVDQPLWQQLANFLGVFSNSGQNGLAAGKSRRLVGHEYAGVDRNTRRVAGHAGDRHLLAAARVSHRAAARPRERAQARRRRGPHHADLGHVRWRAAGLLVGTALRVRFLFPAQRRAAADGPHRSAAHVRRRPSPAS